MGGTIGSRTWPRSHIMKTSSLVTSLATGQPCARKSGISSASARGSSTRPESPCAPTRADFSSTAIVISGSGAWAPPAEAALWRSIRLARWIAPASPAGPAPTNWTSNSRTSRSIVLPARLALGRGLGRGLHVILVREVVLGVDRRHAAAAGGGDGLAVERIGHVAGGEHARDRGARRAWRDLEIAALVHRHLAGEERGVGLMADRHEY